MSSNASKKRKAGDSSSSGNNKKSNKEDSIAIEGFHTYNLEEIRSKLQLLCDRIPAIPDNQFGLLEIAVPATSAPTENGNSTTKGIGNTESGGGDSKTLDEDVIREWAAQLQAVLEEFNLLVCCVATATYKWGTDRSGAADQNLSLLSGELASSQEQIASAVTPRLTNVLAPVVDLVIGKTVKTRDADGREVKENHFTRKLVDPDFVKLCYRILARNAPLLRQVVLSNFSKLLQVLKDYLKAQKNDTQHSRGFTY